MHLPRLEINGFRGIRSLAFPRLGRVTVLTGQNSVGKTTILDAIRLYASRGSANVITELLRNHDEFISVIESDSTIGRDYPNIESLFYDTCSESRPLISIGCKTAPSLFLSLGHRQADPGLFDSEDDETPVLKLSIGSAERTLIGASQNQIQYEGNWGRLSHRSFRVESSTESWPKPFKCQLIGPGDMSYAKIGSLWDQVALTEGENLVIQAINLVLNSRIERVSVVGSGSRSSPFLGRRVLVKLKGSRRPIPLKSLGDGVVRLFGIALGLANSGNGFLLIDEAENGIHHSIQADMWRMIMKTAEFANIQVVATTQSSDCTQGLATAAIESSADGILYRLQRTARTLEAVVYQEDDLAVASGQNIEVR